MKANWGSFESTPEVKPMDVPKNEDGKRDFTIYPAATTDIKGWNYAEQKRQLFINDSRSLFDRHNKGDIREMTIDTVHLSQ